MVSGLKSKRGLGSTTPVAKKDKARSASRTKKMQSTKLLKKDKSRAALPNEQEPEKPLEKNVSGYIPSKPDASNYLPDQVPQTREERARANEDNERGKTVDANKRLPEIKPPAQLFSAQNILESAKKDTSLNQSKSDK